MPVHQESYTKEKSSTISNITFAILPFKRMGILLSQNQLHRSLLKTWLYLI